MLAAAECDFELRNRASSLYFSLLAGKVRGEKFAADSVHRQIPSGVPSRKTLPEQPIHAFDRVLFVRSAAGVNCLFCGLHVEV